MRRRVTLRPAWNDGEIKDVVEERRPAKDFESWETRSVPLFDAQRNSSLACHAESWVNGANGMSDMAGKAAR